MTDDMDSVPSVTLDADDIADRRPRQRPAGNGPMITASGTGWITRALAGMCFVLLIALGGVAYLYQLLGAAKGELAAASHRIEQMEKRLASTDTSITQSEVLLADKLNSMDKLIDTNKSEIRKLWGVSYDKNRKAIEKNTQLNKQLSSNFQQVTKAQKADQEAIAANQNRLDKIGMTAKNSDAAAREAVQRMELMGESVSTLSEDMAMVKERQSKLDSSYSQRIQELEDTAKSTDVFRRNTQDELRKLREELIRQNAASPSL